MAIVVPSASTRVNLRTLDGNLKRGINHCANLHSSTRWLPDYYRFVSRLASSNRSPWPTLKIVIFDNLWLFRPTYVAHANA